MPVHTSSSPFLLHLSRFSARRKRVREVCSDEVVWRAQANLLLAQCLLNQLLKKFRAEDEKEEEEVEGRGVQTVSHSLRAGLIMEGDIPTYPPVTPGYSVTLGGTKPDPLTGEKFTRPPSPGLPRCPLEVLRELTRCLQRAVVLAGRGRQWLVLQNSCRCLWNTIHCLVSYLTSGERTNTPRANRGECTSFSFESRGVVGSNNCQGNSFSIEESLALPRDVAE